MATFGVKTDSTTAPVRVECTLNVVTDAFEKKCCHVDCYTLADCKLKVSHECTSVPVECAMGQLIMSIL